MQRLVIDYVLDSRRPGYTFTSPPQGLSDTAVQDVWQRAMPRGQGWSGYTGARSFKCFPVDGGRLVGFAEVVVTDREDETGRRGIRRAEVTLHDAGAHRAALQARLDALPDSVRAAAEERLSCPRWLRIVERAIPRLNKEKGQVVLAAPYTTPQAWQLVEALLIRVALALPVRAVKGFPGILPLTTLALAARDESPLLALPLDRARVLKGVHVIEIG